jgi:hypothetical protein
MVAKQELAPLAALLGFSCLVQAWVITQATLPAVDTVAFVSMAQEIGREGLLSTIRNEWAQPLFPALVCLTHGLLAGLGLVDPSNWGRSAQVAAAVPLVLAVLPVYLLSRRSVGPKAALAGGLFFCLLACTVRLGANGLSDSTHLALACAALWAATGYFDDGQNLLAEPERSSTSKAGVSQGSVWWLIVAGCLVAVALLARSEVLAVPLAVTLMLAIRLPREGFKRSAGAVVSLALGLLLVLGPYLLVCHTTTLDEAYRRLAGKQAIAERQPFNLGESRPDAAPAAAVSQLELTADWRLSDGRPMAFGDVDPTLAKRFRGVGRALWEFGRELCQAIQYAVGLLALFGMWRARRGINRPIDYFLMLLASVYATGVFVVATTSGYLAARHLLLLVILALPWAGLGGLELGGWLRLRIGTRLVLSRADRRLADWSAVIMAAVACALVSLAPLTAGRQGHELATRWLLARSPEGGAVLDTVGYTALYSGRKTYRYGAAPLAIQDPALAYVVVERAETLAESDRGATLRELLSGSAELVASFESDGSSVAGAVPLRPVAIYRWHPQRFAEWKGRVHAR